MLQELSDHDVVYLASSVSAPFVSLCAIIRFFTILLIAIFSRIPSVIFEAQTDAGSCA